MDYYNANTTQVKKENFAPRPLPQKPRASVPSPSRAPQVITILTFRNNLLCLLKLLLLPRCVPLDTVFWHVRKIWHAFEVSCNLYSPPSTPFISLQGSLEEPESFVLHSQKLLGLHSGLSLLCDSILCPPCNCTWFQWLLGFRFDSLVRLQVGFDFFRRYMLSGCWIFW